jgi:hypothetical protein
MRQRHIFIAAMLLAGVPVIALGQSLPIIDPQTGVPTPTARQKRPVQQDPAGSAFGRNAPLTDEHTGAPQASSRQKKPGQQDPAATAAQQQTGLSEVQARSLLQQQGYASVGTLEAQPNSVWVWQADAMKNGKRVRLGIDHRGNLLELGASATPCALPGLSPNVGGFGVGTRLSEATQCSGR